MLHARLMLLGGLMLLGLSAAQAAPPAYFTDFFRDLKTLQANFDQQVLDGNRQLIQSSKGRMWIQRPGRFRWDYESPYRQQLIADGKHLWSYDESLEQVTVQPASEVLTSTPAMLLSGDRPPETLFSIEPGSSERQVVLIPNNDDSNVTRLTVHFTGSLLTRIDAEDSFGNTTQFSFTDVQRNPPLDDSLFSFTPPDGTDVIGDIEP
jgi:outer membrane lipoprotein carrier protein